VGSHCGNGGSYLTATAADEPAPQRDGLYANRQSRAQESGDSSAAALKAGAAECLLKFFNSGELISAIESAIKKDGKVRSENIELRSIQEKYQSLTPRERDVLPLVASGLGQQADSRPVRSLRDHDQAP
jgi:DNA-binding NarL/FixJ family response regulator